MHHNKTDMKELLEYNHRFPNRIEAVMSKLSNKTLILVYKELLEYNHRFPDGDLSLDTDLNVIESLLQDGLSINKNL